MSKKPNQAIDLDFLRAKVARKDLSEMFAASVATESDMQQATMVKLDRLLNNPYQPRLDIQDESIDDLAQVIKAQGFQGVLVARPDPVNRGFYQITAGHRRREAAKRAGLAALPIVVREYTEEEMATLAITENIQREDLTPLEEGRIYLLMWDEMGLTHEQIAREVGRKRGYIEDRLRIARAPKDVQDLVQAKPDSIRMVAALVKVKNEEERAEMIQHILAGRLMVDDLRGYVDHKAMIREIKDAADKVRTAVREGREVVKVRKALEQIQAQAATSEATEGAEATAQPQSAEAKLIEEARQLLASVSAPTPASTSTLAPVPPTRHSSLVTRHASLSPHERLGKAKLATILRYLNSYKEQLAKRDSISAQERATLTHIKTLVDRLHAQVTAEDEDKTTPAD